MVIGAFVPFLKSLKRARQSFTVLELDPATLKPDELPYFLPADRCAWGHTTHRPRRISRRVGRRRIWLSLLRPFSREGRVHATDAAFGTEGCLTFELLSLSHYLVEFANFRVREIIEIHS